MQPLDLRALIRSPLLQVWRKTPMIAAVVVLGLALGVGSVLTSTSMAWAYLGLPAHALRAERTGSGGPDLASASPRLRAALPGLLTEAEADAALAGPGPASRAREAHAEVVLGAPGKPAELVRARLCDPALYEILGLKFAEGGATWGGAPGVVLSQPLRGGLFGAGEALGRMIAINGRDLVVSGVLAQGETRLPPDDPLAGEQEPPALSMPLDVGSASQMRPDLLVPDPRGDRWLTVWAAGDPAPAAGAADHIAWVTPRAVQGLPPVLLNVLVLTWLFLGLCALGAARQLAAAFLDRIPEIGVRRALGARRRDVLAPMLVEGLLLGGPGGLLGTCLAWGNQPRLHLAMGDAPARALLTLDPRLVLAAPLLGAFAGLLAALGPALLATRVEIATALGGGVRLALRGARTLYALEVAAGLAVFLGFPTLAARVNARLSADGDAEIAAILADCCQGDLKAALAALPGIEAAAEIDRLPELEVTAPARVWLADAPERPLDTWLIRGDEEALSALGATLRAGDPASAGAILSDALAHALVPGGAVVGRRLHVEGSVADVAISGVSPELRARTSVQTMEFTALLPLPPARGALRRLLLRGPGIAAPEHRNALRHALEQVGAPVALVTSSALRRATIGGARLARQASAQIALWSALVVAMGAFAVAALRARSGAHELAIRRAIGARRRDIAAQLLWENAWLTGLGAALGTALVALLTWESRETWSGPGALRTLQGLVLFWVIGQIATLGPAIQAASIPPGTVSRRR